MARTAFYLPEGSRILNRFTCEWMTVEQARKVALRHVEDAINLPSGPYREATLRLIDQASLAIREAEAHAPANDDGDFTPPPARAAIPHALEIAA